MKSNGKYFHYQQPVVDPNKRGLEKWGRGKLVTFPVSYHYNGGIVIEGEWYDGYIVPEPIVPDGYKLYSIHCGLQLNCKPPIATRLVIKSNENSPHQ